MEARLSHLSLWSLTKVMLLANLAAWLIVGLVLAGLEGSGIPILDPEPSPVPLSERATLVFAACLLIGAVHTIALLAGAWLVRTIGRGPSLVVKADTNSLSRTFE